MKVLQKKGTAQTRRKSHYPWTKDGGQVIVMKSMGHVDVKTAMKYQHPELETVRTALNEANAEVGKSGR